MRRIVLALALIAAGMPGSRTAVAADEKMTAAELKELVGPIALYPDVVLDSLLPASAFPDDVAAAATWLASQPAGTTAAPEGSTWDKSVQALVQFPDVLPWMAENIDWVKSLGWAVSAQSADVLAAVQAFRQEAQAAGNLDTDEHMTVTEAPAEEGGTEIIEIAPTNPEVVYVPTYEPTSMVSSGAAWGWGAGLAVGAAGIWAYNEIRWGGNNGGTINVNKSAQFTGSGGGAGYGPNRATQWKAPAAGARPTGTAKPKARAATGTRPGSSAGSRPGSGAGSRPGGATPGPRPSPSPAPGGGARPGGAGGGVTRPSAAPKVAGSQPGRAPGAGGGAAAASRAPKTNPPNHAFGGAGDGNAARNASSRGSSSLQKGGYSQKGYSGRSSGGSSGGSRSGGGGGRSGGGGGGGRGGGGGGRRR